MDDKAEAELKTALAKYILSLFFREWPKLMKK